MILGEHDCMWSAILEVIIQTLAFFGGVRELFSPFLFLSGVLRKENKNKKLMARKLMHVYNFTLCLS